MAMDAMMETNPGRETKSNSWGPASMISQGAGLFWLSLPGRKWSLSSHDARSSAALSSSSLRKTSSAMPGGFNRRRRTERFRVPISQRARVIVVQLELSLLKTPFDP